MNSFWINFGFIILVFFAGAWAIMHWYYRSRRKEDTFRGQDLDLDGLSSLKGSVSDEEYKKIRRKLVEKMTQGADQSLKKEISLEDLEQQFHTEIPDNNQKNN